MAGIKTPHPPSRSPRRSSQQMMWCSTASSLFNGEKSVVFVFITRVLFSLPPSLLLEGFSLFIITLASLVIEICLDNFNYTIPFKTRPGASSGILLGAVTFPAVFITRLIQMLRTFPINEVPEGLEHLKVQYWVTTSCCVSVLLFLCLLWHSSNDSGSTSLRNAIDVKLGLGCFILHSVLCYLSFSSTSGYSILTFLKLLWVLINGFAAFKLIQHALRTFPSCASIGEALLVIGGLVLYFSDMLSFTYLKVHEYLPPSMQVYVGHGIERSKITTITQGLLLGLLLLPTVFKFMLQIKKRFISEKYSDMRMSNEIEKTFIFYSSLAVISILIIPSWMQFVQEFHVHPFLWVIMFVISEPLKRLSLCLYWMTVIYASIGQFYYISKNSKIERILLRKYYHLMAVSMFLPALIFQPMFLDLAFGAALAVFLTLEIIRVWRIWPLGELVHQFMNAFTDHRDSDVLIVSHFSLLLGCAIPMWMCCEYNDRPLAPFAGILSLGIGDTMASVVGHKYGVLRWSKSGKKTMEGTAAGITSVLAACFLILPLLASSTGYIAAQEQNWASLVWAVVVSGLLEAYTTQLDNAFIPLVFFTLVSL